MQKKRTFAGRIKAPENEAKPTFWKSASFRRRLEV